MPDNAYVVGKVARNQPRKLYPDLFEAFAVFLRTAPPRLAERAYLWCHTGYPDLGGHGWNIPSLIREFGVGHRVLLTYTCGACGAVYADVYHDAVAPCRACKEPTAELTNSNKGASREVLARIYNCFDAFVQLATNEGFGLPMVEAAACGVPVAATDYSAMSEVVRGVNGYPIPVQRFVRDAFSNRRFAYPDNGALVAWLTEFLGKPAPVRARMGRDARMGVETHFTYERSARVWETVFDEAPYSETWADPPRLHDPPGALPEDLGDEAFARWCISHVAGRPDRADGYQAVKLARDLAWGPGKGGLTRSDAVHRLLAERQRWNHWERKRGGAK